MTNDVIISIMFMYIIIHQLQCHKKIGNITCCKIKISHALCVTIHSRDHYYIIEYHSSHNKAKTSFFLNVITFHCETSVKYAVGIGTKKISIFKYFIACDVAVYHYEFSISNCTENY